MLLSLLKLLSLSDREAIGEGVKLVVGGFMGLAVTTGLAYFIAVGVTPYPTYSYITILSRSTELHS